jgi:hypothetical protein
MIHAAIQLAQSGTVGDIDLVVLVSDEEVTIQHTVPISDVRLWLDHYSL